MERPYIIIPAHNEANTISSVVLEAKTFATVIVVCDGCSDNTQSLAKDAGALTIELHKNLGYDGALNQGFALAFKEGATQFLTIDADGQHPFSMIPHFLGALKENDVAIGNRNKYQRISERFFGLWTKFRWDINDPLCGMKAYSRKAYELNGAFDLRNSIGTELSLKSIKKGLSYTEIDISCSDREDLPRFGNNLRAEFKILNALLKSMAV